MACRLRPPAPSAPMAKRAVMKADTPWPSTISAATELSPSCSDVTRLPIIISTNGRLAALVRRISSTRGCGACWLVSANSSCRSVVSANAPVNLVISRPNTPVQKMTSWAYATGMGAARRSVSASPSRLRCSIVRTLVVFARGLSGSGWTLGSTSRTRMPRRPSSMAETRPLRPTPDNQHIDITGSRHGRSDAATIGVRIIPRRSTSTSTTSPG